MRTFSVIAGLILTIASIVLVRKVLGAVYLKPKFNVNAAVVGFFLSMAVFLVGMALIWSGLDLL